MWSPWRRRTSLISNVSNHHHNPLLPTDIQIVHSQQSDSVINIKSQHKRMNVVLSLLQTTAVHRMRRRLLFTPYTTSLPSTPHNASWDWSGWATSAGPQSGASASPNCSSTGCIHEGMHTTHNEKDMNRFGGHRMRRISSTPYNHQSTSPIDTAMSCADSAGKLGPSSPISSVVCDLLLNLSHAHRCLLFFFHGEPVFEWLIVICTTNKSSQKSSLASSLLFITNHPDKRKGAKGIPTPGIEPGSAGWEPAILTN